MPDDEQTAAGSAAGSEPADGALPEPPGGANLGRVPHFAPEAGEPPRRPQARGRVLAEANPAPAGRRNRNRLGAPWRPRFEARDLIPIVGLLLFASCVYGLLHNGGRTVSPSFAPGPIIPARVTVVIDPGHGGTDSGAIAQGVVEKDLNLDVGLRVARVLVASGLNVKLTREDDHYVPLESRVDIANALPGAIFVSIHFNDAQGEGRAATGRASGIETYYSGVKETTSAPAVIWTSLFRGSKAATNLAAPDAVQAGVLLADSIQHALIEHTAAADRGIKEAGLYVTRRVRGPAVLVEGGFVSHPQEAHLLQDPAYRQTIANSIAEGIVKFLEMAQPPAGASPPPSA